MKRVRSPVSENTIRRLVEEEDYLSDSVVCELPSPKSDGWKSGSKSSDESSAADDTDDDPTYDPEQPSTSSRFVGLRLKPYTRFHPILRDTDDSDSEETVDLVSPRLVTKKCA